MTEASKNVNTTPANGAMLGQGETPAAEGLYKNRTVTASNGEKNIPKNGHRLVSEEQTPLGDRDVTVLKSTLEDYQNCQFQSKVAHGLLEADSELGDDLVVYYLDENGNEVFVDPRDEDACSDEVYEEYLSSRLELEANREAILANCDKALAKAQQVAISDGVDLTEESLNEAESAAVEFSQLLAMAVDKDSSVEGRVLDASEDTPPTTGEGYFATFIAAEDQESPPVSEVERKAPEKSVRATPIDPMSDGKDGQAVTPSEQTTVETPPSGKQGEPAISTASSNLPEGDTVSPSSPLEDKTAVEEQQSAQNVEKAEVTQKRDSDTPAILGKQPISLLAKTLPAVAGKVTAEQEATTEKNPPEYKLPAYKRGTLNSLRDAIADIKKAEKSEDPKTREFQEKLLSSLYMLDTKRAEMEYSCKKLDYLYKPTDKNYNRNPPDNKDEKEQAIQYREAFISDTEACIKRFDQGANGLIAEPQWYGSVKNHLADELEELKEKNLYDEKSTSLVKRTLDATIEEDIGVSLSDLNKLEDVFGNDESLSGRLLSIMSNVAVANKQGSMKEGIHKGVNNEIKGIIDTKEKDEYEGTARIIKGVRASRLVQATAVRMIKNAREEMDAIHFSSPFDQANEVRGIRDKYELALKQLYPKHWGSNKSGAREGQISNATCQHINQSVDLSIKKLDDCVRQHRPGGKKDDNLTVDNVFETIASVLNDINDTDQKERIDKIKHSASGQETPLLSDKVLQKVTAMIKHDDDFCEGLVAAFSSLQGTFAGGVSIGNTYQQRSDAAMRMLRANHKLTESLSSPNILAAVMQDVSQPDSKLMPHFINRYGGKDRTKGEELRSIKVIKQAIDFLEQEQKKNQDSVLKNKSVRDCFQKGAVYEKETASSGNQAKLSAGPQLLNTFLSGMNKSAVIHTPQTQEDHINTGVTIEGKSLIFSGEPLSAELLGSRWAIDPGFIIDDHPEIQVPFETKDGKSRDWIPIKDSQSGKTAILAMSKKGGAEPKPFLYEMDSQGQWRCVPLAAAGKPEEDSNEELEGTLFAMAACYGHEQETALGNLASRVKALGHVLYKGSSEQLAQEVRHTFELFQAGSNQWISSGKSNDVDELVGKVAEAVPSQQAYYLREIEGAVDVSDVMANTNIRTPQAFAIKAKKKLNDTAKEYGSGINDIAPDKLSSDIGTFHLPPAYLAGTIVMIEGLREVYKDHPSMKDIINQLESKITDYGNEASTPSLHAFQGCIVDVGNFASAESMDHAKAALKTVIAKSRRHTALLFQEREKNREEVQKLLVKEGGELNTNLFEHALLLFERNKIPDGLTKDEKGHYIQSMASYLLLNNAYQVEHQQLDKKEQLLKGFDSLELRRISSSRDEFEQAVKQWNLEMALVAEQQWTVDNQLSSYENESLNSKTLARLAFECRAKTVLRSNQVDEVKEALDEITQAMHSQDTEGMRRVSQKGTGWGKSTVIKMLADHACAQLQGLDSDVAQKRSVLVIAPKSNQAELDIALGQYFRQGGRAYRRLDMSQYTGHQWWTEKALDEIHNTLLGLSADTELNDRQALLQATERAPVGASVEDIQVLLHLRNALSANDATSENKQKCEKLNRICDLLRESMMFSDEWDSALMPPQPSVLDDMAKTINKSLNGLGSDYQASADTINTAQSSFIMESKRKHLLSATTGSPYLLLQATGEVDAAKASEVSHLSLQESTIRALRWFSEAEILYSDGSENLESTIANQVVERVGVDQGIIYLDANNEHNGKAKGLAERVRPALANARQHNRNTTLFYDENKHIHECSVDVNDKEQIKPLGKAKEGTVRQIGAKGFDTILSQRESIGTDCPQSVNTPLIHLGFLAQKEAGLDYASQQLGRMRHDQPVKKQRKMVVVTAQELKELRQHTNRRVSKKADDAKLKRDMQAGAEKKLLNTLPEKIKVSDRFRKLLTKQLDFPVNGKGSDALEKALNKALDEAVEEWDSLGELTPEHRNAIREFKRAQFNSETAIRLLIFEMLAVRDKSNTTIAFENKLEKTSKKALAESLLAEEQHIFDTIAKSKVSELQQKIKLGIAEIITDKVTGKDADYASEKAEKIAAKVAEETIRSLTGIARPVLSPDGSKALEALKSSSFTVEHVEKIVQDKENKAVASIGDEALTQHKAASEQYDSELKLQLNSLSSAWKKMSRNHLTPYKQSYLSLNGNKEPGILTAVTTIDEAMKQVKEGSYQRSADSITSLRKKMLRILGNMHAKNMSGRIEPKIFEEKMQDILEDILGRKEIVTKGRQPKSFIIKLSNNENIALKIEDYNPGQPCLTSTNGKTWKLLKENKALFTRSVELTELAKQCKQTKTEYEKIESVDNEIREMVSEAIKTTGDELIREMAQVCKGPRAGKIEQHLKQEKQRAMIKKSVDQNAH
ncbi:hypothetical protein N9V90_00145 [Endozoicomonas sp.]|nr:hypothetical protein [Endozoicomonas sp.]